MKRKKILALVLSLALCFAICVAPALAASLAYDRDKIPTRDIEITLEYDANNELVSAEDGAGRDYESTTLLTKLDIITVGIRQYMNLSQIPSFLSSGYPEFVKDALFAISPMPDDKDYISIFIGKADVGTPANTNGFLFSGRVGSPLTIQTITAGAATGKPVPISEINIINRNGQYYLPIRAIMQALKGNIYFDEDTASTTYYFLDTPANIFENAISYFSVVWTGTDGAFSSTTPTVTTAWSMSFGDDERIEEALGGQYAELTKVSGTAVNLVLHAGDGLPSIVPGSAPRIIGYSFDGKTMLSLTGGGGHVIEIANSESFYLVYE